MCVCGHPRQVHHQPPGGVGRLECWATDDGELFFCDCPLYQSDTTSATDGAARRAEAASRQMQAEGEG